MNGDTDATDNVFRWTQIVANTLPILPLNTPANIHALFDVPGGTHGVAELGNLFVIEVSENADNLDINGDTLKTFNLIGWLSPSTTAQAWDFTHGSANNTFVGASWMAEQRDRAQLDVAFEERVGGVSINNVPPSNPGDSDTLDSVPTFASFGGSPAHMVFPGVAIAVQANNAGILVARGTGFYRVDEAADNRDWNGDTDKSDFVLWRTSLSQGTSAFMATLNSLNRPAIEFNVDEQPFGAAFLTDETMQGAGGTDINGDGTKHLIVQYFKF